MKKNMRCPVCGRMRKNSHEAICGTTNAYSPNCVVYEKFDGRSFRATWKKNVRDRMEVKNEKGSEK